MPVGTCVRKYVTLIDRTFCGVEKAPTISSPSIVICEMCPASSWSLKSLRSIGTCCDFALFINMKIMIARPMNRTHPKNPRRFFGGGYAYGLAYGICGCGGG